MMGMTFVAMAFVVALSAGAETSFGAVATAVSFGILLSCATFTEWIALRGPTMFSTRGVAVVALLAIVPIFGKILLCVMIGCGCCCG